MPDPAQRIAITCHHCGAGLTARPKADPIPRPCPRCGSTIFIPSRDQIATPPEPDLLTEPITPGRVVFHGPPPERTGGAPLRLRPWMPASDEEPLPPRPQPNVLAGLCSFLVPGLGQFLLGEVGLAFAYLIVALLLWIALLGWIVNLISAYYASQGEILKWDAERDRREINANRMAAEKNNT